MPSLAPQSYAYWMPDRQALVTRAEGGAPLYLDVYQLLDVVRANTSGIPVGWFVGMAEREIGGRTLEGPFKWNEVATDYDSEGDVKGGDTYGLFQLRKSTFVEVLSSGAISDESACDPAKNAAAFSRKMNNNLLAIRLAAPSAPDWDVWCYLAWSHNAGLGDVLPSIARYGLDWDAAKARPQNEWFRTRLVPYAEWIANRAADYPELGRGTNTMLPRLAVLALAVFVGWRLWHGESAIPA